ncbi:MAG: hypothetical protein ACYT04_67140, partial [Nostoc sp.]
LVNEEMSQRLNAIIPDEVNDDLIKISQQENRTKSQMTGILLAKGIDAYYKEQAKKPKSSESDKDEGAA